MIPVIVKCLEIFPYFFSHFAFGDAYKVLILIRRYIPPIAYWSKTPTSRLPI